MRVGSLSSAVLVGGSLILSVALGGCATGGAAAAPRRELAHRASFVEPERVATPVTPQEAQAVLSSAVDALHVGRPREALGFIEALLRSDHLTDRGRANMYWLAAECARGASDEDAMLDALGGFLVAADVLPADRELTEREVRARATRLARRLQRDPGLARSPDDAVSVEDASEANGVIAELGCGHAGQATWIDGGTRSLVHQERRLEGRILTCSESGEQRELWFDLAAAR